MSNVFKSVITGALMSLSRLNQVKGRDNDILSVDDETIQEQKVRKDEINIISEKRFYELLNATDDYFRRKREDRNKQILESRGIKEDFLSFKNVSYEPSLHEQLSGNTERTYKFKTDNDICKYSTDVHISKENDIHTLSFLINLTQHPIVRKIGYDLKNLTAFAINENMKIYAYSIIEFKGIITPNENEIFITFGAKCEVDGQYPRELSNQSSTMRKEDLIDPRTYKL